MSQEKFSERQIEEFASNLRQHLLYNNLKEVKNIIPDKLNVNGRFDDDETPLMIASTYGHIEMMEYLLKCGADVDAISDDGDDPGTALDYAIVQTHVDTHVDAVELLLKYNANPNTINILDGQSCLHSAAGLLSFDIVKLLVGYGSNHLLKGNDGLTALELVIDEYEDGRLYGESKVDYMKIVQFLTDL